MGFRDFRVRLDGGLAKLQLPASQMPLLLERRREAVRALKTHCRGAVLDLEARDEQ